MIKEKKIFKDIIPDPYTYLLIEIKINNFQDKIVS